MKGVHRSVNSGIPWKPATSRIINPWRHTSKSLELLKKVFTKQYEGEAESRADNTCYQAVAAEGFDASEKKSKRIIGNTRHNMEVAQYKACFQLIC